MDFRIYYLRGKRFEAGVFDKTPFSDIGQALQTAWGYPVGAADIPSKGMPPEVEQWCMDNDVSYEIIRHQAISAKWAVMLLRIERDREAVVFKLRWL